MRRRRGDYINRRLYILFGTLAAALCLVLAYMFRPMTMNDIYDKPRVDGVVLEVNEDNLLILVNEGEDERQVSDKISVSLDVQLKDSSISFNAGDAISVFYDGNIAESYPAQINTVYALIIPKGVDLAQATSNL